ncbi:MAG: hypothetical protein ACRDPY_30225 [Streptosporangiaceae bacterium]
MEAAGAVIRAGMLRLGAGMLEQLLAADNGYRGRGPDCGNGHQGEFVAYRHKTLDTVPGPVTLTRAWYHCAVCKHGFAPRDAELGVAGTSLSPGLTAMNDTAAATGPFGKAAVLLAELGGVTLTAKRVERAAEASGAAQAAAVRERASLISSRKVTPLPPRPLPDMLYGVIDGTGVPMTARETAGRNGKAEDGRARTREVKLAVFFTQDTLDEGGYPVRDPRSSSYIAAFEPASVFAGLVEAEGIRRGANHVRQLTILGDGAPRMRYKWFRQCGLFTGSGVVEAGCKAVIGQRLKLAGMHWAIPGADAITTLRCQQASRPEDRTWYARHNQTRPA